MATPENKVKTLIKLGMERFEAMTLTGDTRPGAGLLWTYWPVNCGMGRSGVPDVIGTVCGNEYVVPFAIEAKAEVRGGKTAGPTPLQVSEMRIMRARGFHVACIGRRKDEGDTDIALRVERLMHAWWAGYDWEHLVDYEYLLTE